MPRDHLGTDPEHPDAGELAATFCATLVDEWVHLGVTEAVVCPGSRNTPISVALVTDERIRTHVVHDERSAGFLALGLARSTGMPPVLNCTSGSAPTHFHPAVAEADLAAFPMIVVTADRPPELQGVLAPQTIDQRDLYGGAVRWYCEPGPPAHGSQPWWRDLAGDTIARACGLVPGPVHLNLAFREPLVGAVGTLPPGESRPRHDQETVTEAPLGTAPGTAPPWNVPDETVVRLTAALSQRRGVLVAGARACISDDERREVLDFAETMGWPVFADPTSGLRVEHPSVVACFDPLVRSGAFSTSEVEVVFRLGGLVASRPVDEWLRGGTAAAPFTVAVDRHGLCPDPHGMVSERVVAVPAELLAGLAAASPDPGPARWTEAWYSASAAARSAVSAAIGPPPGGPIDEPATAVAVMSSMPGRGELVVGSSMPVRDLESFAPPRFDVRVHANRGTNGIDGSIATATGIAIGSGVPTVLLCGDVTFLHDVGSLNGIARRGIDLTIVVIDNDGGGIFHFLPQADRLEAATFEAVLGTPHGHDVAAIAGGFGLSAEVVHTRAGLAAALAGAARRRGVRVVVVHSDRHRNTMVHQAIQAEVDRAVWSVLGRRGPRAGGEAR